MKINNNSVDPIKEKAVSNITAYGTEKNKIEIETVASFINYFNYLNTPKYKTVISQIGEQQSTELVPINYTFNDAPEIELIFRQTKLVVLDGERITNITKEHIQEILSKCPNLTFKQILNDIQNNSEFSDMGLKIR